MDGKSHTKNEVKVLTLDEVASRACVSVRTLRKWLKKPGAPRQIADYHGKNILLLDDEVEFWLDYVINRTYPKRTWTKALDYLKNLCLINRDTLLVELQKRHDQVWTDLAKKANGFDDSHVEAYRRGVSSAIYIARNHGIETWDYVPKIRQHVFVGGCGGVITKITEDRVVVQGVYHYYMGENIPSQAEAWTMTYKLSDVIAARPRPWVIGNRPGSRKEKNISWNYEHIPHTSS